MLSNDEEILGMIVGNTANDMETFEMHLNTVKKNGANLCGLVYIVAITVWKPPQK